MSGSSEPPLHLGWDEFVGVGAGRGPKEPGNTSLRVVCRMLFA